MNAATSDKAAVRDISGSILGSMRLRSPAGRKTTDGDQRSYGGAGEQDSARPPRLLYAARWSMAGSGVTPYRRQITAETLEGCSYAGF
jgi:hypothetical protein